MEGNQEEEVTMEENVYCEGLAKTLLPEGYEYHFDKLDVVSDMDENGEVKMDIIGRAKILETKDVKTFLEEFYASSGSSFNVKSGRADRRGAKDVEVYGYRKCIMQVHQTNQNRPRRKGLHQDCPAKLQVGKTKGRMHFYFCIQSFNFKYLMS